MVANTGWRMMAISNWLATCLHTCIVVPTYYYPYRILLRKFLHIYIVHHLQFVLLMDLLYMKEEWKCSTMVYGVRCVIMDGIYMMHKLYAVNWVLAKQLLLCIMHSMERVLDRFGWIIWTVLVMKRLLETVHIMDGTPTMPVIIVTMEMMLV